MQPVVGILVLVGVLLVATVVGLLLRRNQGRARSVPADSGATAESGGTADSGTTAVGLAPEAAFGSTATLVQFSTETCARCPATRRQLQRLADERPGVATLEIDLGERPELASRYGVMQTPTVLLVDNQLLVRTRFGGPPRQQELLGALDALTSRNGPTHEAPTTQTANGARP